MKAIFNALSPFFDNEGRPLSAGRILFCALGSDSERIGITDKDGVALENPLPLNDLGRFVDGKQPFVDDTTSFTAYVQKRTSAPIHGDDGYDDNPAWETIYSFDVLGDAAPIGGETGQLPTVQSIADLRKVDPSATPSVFLLGYNRAGDAPAKVYTWDKDTVKNNGGSHISSAIDGTGCWVMESGPSDVRNWGVFPDVGDVTTEFRQCFNAITSEYSPLYVPSGVYDVSENLSYRYALQVADVARFRNVSSDNDATLSVGEFIASIDSVHFIGAPDEDKPYYVLPCLQRGVLHTEWFAGDLSKLYKSTEVMQYIDELHYGTNLEGYSRDPQKNFIVKAFEKGKYLRKVVWPSFADDGSVDFWNETSNANRQFRKPVMFNDEVALMGKTSVYGDVELSESGTLNVKRDATFNKSIDAADINFSGTVKTKDGFVEIYQGGISANFVKAKELNADRAIAKDAVSYLVSLYGAGVYTDAEDYGGKGTSWLRFPFKNDSDSLDISNIDVESYSVGQLVFITNVNTNQRTLGLLLASAKESTVTPGSFFWSSGRHVKIKISSGETVPFIYLGKHPTGQDGVELPHWSIIGKDYDIG